MPEDPKPTPDGITDQPAPAAPASAAAPAPSLLEAARGWAAVQAVNLALMLLVWLVSGALLWLVGAGTANALGFGFLIAFFGGFLFRHAIASLLGQSISARIPGFAPPAQAQPGSPVEGLREVVETVVFVVVLVLLLKSFVAEAFVIPTGSMAETLYGYQKMITCPSCGRPFPVNASNEAEGSQGKRIYVDGCTCPNCRQRITIYNPSENVPADEEGVNGMKAVKDPGFVVGPWAPPIAQMLLNGPHSGDRVLVSKYPYDLPGSGPRRLDVVVFKFPGDDQDGHFPASGPYKNHVPINYIKRLIGLPGETIAIQRGKLFSLPPGELTPGEQPYPEDVKALEADPSLALRMWRQKEGHLHENDANAQKLFEGKKFSIVRKTPDVLTAMMRIVYDNDHPAKDLLSKPEHLRWRPDRDSEWGEHEERSFAFSGGATASWLRYHHVLRDDPGERQLITDFMGYNAGLSGNQNRGSATGGNWVGDLIVECQVKAEKGEGELVLELSRGPSRYRAKFDANSGSCTLVRERDGKAVDLETKPTTFKGPGAYDLRFANVDDRLTVWVNGDLPFGDGVAYEPEERLSPTEKNDLEPASLGASGGRFTVRHLKLHRDTYYTTGKQGGPGEPDVRGLDPKKPSTWADVGSTPFLTLYVQPGHYLCLGDNSPESSDGRSWGLVPARLLLGRAVVVYFPFTRVGRIR